MMSRQISTHSSQMYTVGPAMSFLTSRWLLLQKEQRRTSPLPVFFDIQPPGWNEGGLDSRPAGRNRQPNSARRPRNPPLFRSPTKINAGGGAIFQATRRPSG